MQSNAPSDQVTAVQLRLSHEARVRLGRAETELANYKQVLVELCARLAAPVPEFLEREKGDPVEVKEFRDWLVDLVGDLLAESPTTHARKAPRAARGKRGGGTTTRTPARKKGVDETMDED